jgi:DNA-binding NarL/FixJ family response regulator
MSDIRVLIVEDEPLIAEDIAATLLQADFDVSAIAYSKEDALYQLMMNQPDMVLLDINLNGGIEGIEIAEQIKRKFTLPFIYLTSYSDKQTLEKAKKTEPSGYIVKPFSEASLCAVIEIALYNHAQKTKAYYPALNLGTINRDLVSPLSEREFEVLCLIYEGKTNLQIAAQIFISINTVKKHINSAYMKINAETRSGAIATLRKLMEKEVIK